MFIFEIIAVNRLLFLYLGKFWEFRCHFPIHKLQFLSLNTIFDKKR